MGTEGPLLFAGKEQDSRPGMAISRQVDAPVMQGARQGLSVAPF